MVDVVQLVRASDCGSECRGFESHHPPLQRISGNPINKGFPLFFYTSNPRHKDITSSVYCP